MKINDLTEFDAVDFLGSREAMAAYLLNRCKTMAKKSSMSPSLLPFVHFMH